MRISDWSSDVCSSDLDLVCLHAVVERGDLEVELLRQVDHRRHLVGAVAVDVHEDVAVEHACQRFQLEVALVVLAVAAFALRALVAVRGGVDERGAVTGDVAHARRWAALLAVNALGALARSEAHTSELKYILRLSYAYFRLNITPIYNN